MSTEPRSQVVSGALKRTPTHLPRRRQQWHQGKRANSKRLFLRKKNEKQHGINSYNCESEMLRKHHGELPN
jgi:hypothetical protein